MFITDLEVKLSIGVLASERLAKQNVLVSAEVFVPLESCTPKADSIKEVFDYTILRNSVLAFENSVHINLVETLCDAIARKLLSQPAVQAAKVNVSKPDIFSDCKAVGVEVFLTK